VVTLSKKEIRKIKRGTARDMRFKAKKKREEKRMYILGAERKKKTPPLISV